MRKLIDALKKEEGLHRFRLNQLMAGHPAPAKKRKYQDATVWLPTAKSIFSVHVELPSMFTSKRLQCITYKEDMV